MNANDTLPESRANSIPGPGGEPMSDWLEAAIIFGSFALFEIVREALDKRLASGQPLTAFPSLFDSKDKAILFYLLSQILSPSDLIGRSRLYRAAGTVTPLQFGMTVGNLKPTKPLAAVDTFAPLIPRIERNPEAFRLQQVRIIEQMTNSVAEQITKIVQYVDANGKAVGRDDDAESLLNRAGFTPANPVTSQSIIRTETMEAINNGQEDELEESGLAAEFPVWQYHAVIRRTSRPWHAARNKLFWERSMPFNLVRGVGARNVRNCLCNGTFIRRRDWERMQKTGATVQPWESS